MIYNHGSQISILKSNNHIENRQVFVCSFMKPGGSLRVLKYPKSAGSSLIMIFVFKYPDLTVLSF